MGKGGKGEKKAEGGKRAAKQGLVEKNGACTDQFRAVLREIFRRFDCDRDGALSMGELEEFARASGTGSQIQRDEHKQVSPPSRPPDPSPTLPCPAHRPPRAHPSRRQLSALFDTDARGNLTLKGFEQMYLMQTNHQPDDTWRDLEKLGYDRSSLALLHPEAVEEDAASPEALQAARMEEMRAALTELKVDGESASAHRRMGRALDALGRTEAAQREYAQAESLESKAASTIDEQD